MQAKTSLISRLNLAAAALGLAVVAVATMFFVHINSYFLRNAIAKTLRGYSESVATHVVASSDPADWQRIARTHELSLLVETRQMRQAFDPTGAPISPDEVADNPHGALWIDVEIPGTGERVMVGWNLERFTGGHWPLLVGYLVLLMSVIGASHWFQRSQLRPLQWLRAGVEAVARGEFKTKVPVVRQDEIGQVAGAFNQMTQQVERMVVDRERLLGDVSHELRSPLARIKVALELLPASEKRSAIERDVREMEALISVLLEREHLRARTDRFAAEPVDLVAVVRQVVDAFADRAPGVTFFAADEPLVAAADADLLRLLVQNLVDNAVKFSLPDSRSVEVRLQPAEDTIELLVSDDGRGIAEDDAERIFEPFVKLDPARGHRSGYGLGLNLCRRIVEVHRGSIRMLPNPDRGTCAQVILPRMAPRDGNDP